MIERFLIIPIWFKRSRGSLDYTGSPEPKAVIKLLLPGTPKVPSANYPSRQAVSCSSPCDLGQIFVFATSESLKRLPTPKASKSVRQMIHHSW